MDDRTVDVSQQRLRHSAFLVLTQASFENCTTEPVFHADRLFAVLLALSSWHAAGEGGGRGDARITHDPCNPRTAVLLFRVRLLHHQSWENRPVVLIT